MSSAYLSKPFGPAGGAERCSSVGTGKRRMTSMATGGRICAGFHRAEIRPRVFWDNHSGSSVFMTAGAMLRSRATGGTVEGALLPATQAPYRETLDTGRYDFGIVAQTLLSNAYVVSVRASGTWQSHDHTFGDLRERDTHNTLFGEVSARRNFGRHTVVVGVALDRDAFALRRAPVRLYVHDTRRVRAGRCERDAVAIRVWQRTTRPSQHIRHLHQPPGVRLFRSGGWTTPRVYRDRVLPEFGAHGRDGSGGIVPPHRSRTLAGGNRRQRIR